MGQAVRITRYLTATLLVLGLVGALCIAFAGVDLDRPEAFADCGGNRCISRSDKGPPRDFGPLNPPIGGSRFVGDLTKADWRRLTDGGVGGTQLGEDSPRIL